MRQSQGWVLALVAALCLTACSKASDTNRAVEGAVNAAASESSVPISTSPWRPGDPSHLALITAAIGFTSDGCPLLGTERGVVWPAGFTSVVKPGGEQVIVTADGREISEGDTIEAAGATANEAESGMPCIEPGTTLTYIQSSVEIMPSR
jgi:hypothetical protein